MSKERLEALETEVNAELKRIAVAERIASPEGYIPHNPITDGVVDIDRYLSSSPKILWILKEPWENLKDGEAGGDWSVTKYLAEGEICNRGSWPPIAYVAYSVFHNYPKWKDIGYVTADPMVRDSLRKIAYINVKKFPGKPTSYAPDIKFHYRRNRNILKKQIDTINPDIIIGGYTLDLFFADLDLKYDAFKTEGSVSHCTKGRRLYIDAYHPSQWTVKKDVYVDDIVMVIKNYITARKTSESPG